MKYLILLSLTIASGFSSAAFDPIVLMSEIEQKQTGFSSFKAHLEMQHSKDNKTDSDKQITVFARENPDDGQYRLFSFTAPKKLEGASLLSRSHHKAADEQWLYLSSFKKSRSLSASFQRKYFDKTLLSFEDFNFQAFESYEYEALGEVACADSRCLLVERRPYKTKKSRYGKQFVFVDKIRRLIVKIEFYTRRRQLLKTLHFEDYALLEGGIWWAKTMRMVNSDNDVTVMEWREIELGVELDPKLFDNDKLGHLGK